MCHIYIPQNMLFQKSDTPDHILILHFFILLELPENLFAGQGSFALQNQTDIEFHTFIDVETFGTRSFRFGGGFYRRVLNYLLSRFSGGGRRLRGFTLPEKGKLRATLLPHYKRHFYHFNTFVLNFIIF